jgi:hypothetical protein
MFYPETFKCLQRLMRVRYLVFVLQPVFHQPTSEVDLITAPQTGDRTVGRTSCTIDTALLRECRLIYLESRFIPVHNCIHDFYGHRWNRLGDVSIYRRVYLTTSLTLQRRSGLVYHKMAYACDILTSSQTRAFNKQGQ